VSTIIALSTPWGRSAVGVIRLSGEDARAIASAVCPGGPVWRPRRASVRAAVNANGETIDEVVAIWMPGPKSYTGEDVVELCGHGNPILLAALLDALVAQGARPARPGEFTRRALENQRTDLLGAEALSALISARTMEGAQDALLGIKGGMHKDADRMREVLLDLAAELEARLDHPDDDLSLQSDETVSKHLLGLAKEAEDVASTWSASRVRQQGATVAVDGMDITFMDTAGEGGTDDDLEQAGVALGQSLSASADLLLVVLPLDRPIDGYGQAMLERTKEHRRLIVGSFADCPVHPQSPSVDHSVDNVEGKGIEALLELIRASVGAEPMSGQAVVVLSQRQHDLYRSVSMYCIEAVQALQGELGPAVAVHGVMCAIERLSELTGLDVREAVLDRLFARFCIGK
jgi:tRNA modification GTPase